MGMNMVTWRRCCWEEMSHLELKMTMWQRLYLRQQIVWDSQRVAVCCNELLACTALLCLSIDYMQDWTLTSQPQWVSSRIVLHQSSTWSLIQWNCKQSFNTYFLLLSFKCRFLLKLCEKLSQWRQDWNTSICIHKKVYHLINGILCVRGSEVLLNFWHNICFLKVGLCLSESFVSWCSRNAQNSSML